MKSSLHLFQRALRLWFMAAMVVAGASSAEEPAQTPLNVVLLYSGDIFSPGVVLQDQPLRGAFTAGTKHSVNFYVETLLVNNLSSIEFDAQFVRFMREKYQGQSIDLIIAGGNPALNFLERNRLELWSNAPAMFFSVDEDGIRQRKSPPAMPGVTMKFDPKNTLDFAVQLQPAARRVVVVTGASGWDHFWLPEIQNYLQSRHPDLSATYLTNNTVAELSAQLSRLPADTIVLLTTFYADSTGKHTVGVDVCTELSAISAAPIYGFYDIALGRGIVGGVMPGMEEHGRRAGALALQLIAGVNSGSVHVPVSSPNVAMVDWRQLQRWGISERRLPPGTVISFRKPNFWELYHWQITIICGVIVLQSALIFSLLAQRRVRRRAEVAARESESRMNLAVSSAKAGLWSWDIKTNELWVSPEYRALLGFPLAGPVTNDMFNRLIHPEDRKRRADTLEQVLRNGTDYEVEYRILSADGSLRWISSQGRCQRDAAGKAVRLLGAITDITERKQAELELHHQRTELLHASRLAIVGELTASIAHEINQPLGAVLNNAEAAEMLLERENPRLDEVRQILSDIKKADLRASEVIRRMRSLLRKREVEMLPLDLNDAVSEVLRLIANDAQRRGVTVDSELGIGLPVLHGDKVHLQQVLLNLLLNGMDAMAKTPETKRLLAVHTHRTPDGMVEVAVTDAGHGILPDRSPRLFESFYTTKKEGMGLGLSIARSIIEAHHGRIWAENNADGGATFRFALPVNAGNGNRQDT